MLSPPRNRGFRSCPRGLSLLSLGWCRLCPVGGFSGVPSEAPLVSLRRHGVYPRGDPAGVLRGGEALCPEGGIVGLPSGNGMSGLGRVRYLCALLRSVSPACVLH